MNANEKAWYQIDNIEEVDSPAFVIYLDRVKHNIALAIDMIGDVSRLRPHVKTHKSEQVTSLMMQSGITKFKCATIAEAEMLGRCGAVDVLLAYQPVGPKIRRFISLIKQFPDTRYSCLVDNTASAQTIAVEAIANNTTIDAFIDLNIGMNRTGALPKDAVSIYKTCQRLEGLQVIGIHGYDGHINDSDLQLRAQRANEAFKKLKHVQDGLVAAGLPDPVAVIGGSPTYTIHAKTRGVECSPGTFVYWDHSYSGLFRDMAFLPAGLVISRVVSLINETNLCLDLGHKSIAAENPLGRRVHFLNAPDITFVSQSEEHLVVAVPAGHSWNVGDVFYGVPFHVCPTCALYETAIVIENASVKEQWEMIARDRKITI